MSSPKSSVKKTRSNNPSRNPGLEIFAEDKDAFLRGDIRRVLFYSKRSMESIKVRRKNLSLLPRPVEYEDGYRVVGEIYRVMHDFKAENADELSVSKGEKVMVLRKDADGWWDCAEMKGWRMGIVPESYLGRVAKKG